MTESNMQPTYPDISDLLAARARRRLELAALSWEAKVAIIERMRQLLPRDAWKNRSADSARGQDQHATSDTQSPID
jgi:hypothetical protein